MGRSNKQMVYGPCGGRAMRGGPDMPVWAEVSLHDELGTALLFLIRYIACFISILHGGTSLCMFMCSCLCAHVAVCYIIADLTMRPPRGGSTRSTPLRVYGIPTFLSRVSQRGLWP